MSIVANVSFVNNYQSLFLLNATVVNTSTINANEISTGTLYADTISTNILTANLISSTELTVGSTLKVYGDITAVNVTATDKIESYFNDSQYLTSAQALLPEIAGSNAFFYDVTSERNFLSSIVTNSINLDNNFLDTGGAGTGAVLLLNGIPIATISTSISSLQEWSYYPAISTVYMNSNTIVEAGDIQTATLNADNIYTYDLEAVNQIVFGTNLYGGDATLSNVSAIKVQANLVSTLNLQANTASFINTTTTQSFTNTLGATNITGVTGNISDFVANTANIAVTNINQVNATNELVSGTLTVNEVRGVNGFINVDVANRIRMRVRGSIDPFSSPELDLEAGGGNRGIVNLIANPGDGGIQGEVNVTAKGGTALGYATGGLLNLTATRGTAVLGTANTSRVNIAADSITSYAGGATPFVGVLGYNFVYGLLGVNIVAGTPPAAVNVPGTVYLYGLNPLGTGSSGGVRVQNGISVDVLYPYPAGFIAPQYDLIIRGNPAGQKVTLCNVRYLYGDGAEATGFNNMNATNLNGTNLNATTMYGTNIFASNINVSSATISSFTSLNGNIQSLFNVSTINGFTVDQLVSTVTPPQFTSTTSTFQQLFTSSLQAVNISSITANITQISGLSTLNGYTVEQLISSVSPLVFFSTVSSFQQLATSSLNVSSIIGTASNLNILTPQLLLNGTPASQVLQLSTTQQLFTSSLVGNNLSSETIQVSSINGYNLNDLANQPQLSTFLELFASTGIIYNASNVVLNVSSINGFNTSQFIAAPYVSTLSSFQEVFTSSLQANNVSTNTLTAQSGNVQQLLTSTLNGYTISQLINQPQISTFQQLFTSSLVANNISSGVIQVSSINGFNLAQLVSTVSPPTPAPSTFQQLFTSSLSASNTNLSLFASNIAFTASSNITTSASNITNAATGNIGLTVGSNYTMTAANNISLNSSNTASLYTTNTAPTPPAQGIVILGQGNTNIQSQADTNITSGNNILVNASQTSILQGSNVNVNAVQQIQLTASNSIVANSSTINLTGSLVINGVPYVAPTTQTTVSTFQQLFTSSIGNDPSGSPNLVVTAGNILNLQANYTYLQGSQQILITSPEELRASSSNLTLDVPSGQSLIYLNQDDGVEVNTNKNIVMTALSNIALSSATLTINGQPYGSAISSFSTLATNTLTNNEPSPSLNILSRVAATISTGNTLLIDSGEILTYSRSLIDFFAKDGVALSSQTIYLDAINTNVEAALNAPQINTSTIVGNTITAPIQFASTIYTNTLRNNDSLGFELNIIAAYPSISSIATLIEGENFSLLATDQGTITAEQFYISSGYTSIEAGDLVLQGNNSIEITSLTDNITVKPGFDVGGTLILRGNLDLCNNTITNVSNINLTNINGSPYTPGGGGSAISTFQQLFTSSFVVNTINGVAYPPPDSQTVSTFNQLYTSSLQANTVSTTTLTAQTTSTQQLNASTLNGFTVAQFLAVPYVSSISTFQQLFTSSLNVNTINGAAYPPPASQTVSTFQQLFTSSFNTNTINGAAYPPPASQTVSTFQQLFTSSFVTNAINGAAYPPPAPQTVSTFQQLFTSSFVTNTINGAAYPPPAPQQLSTFNQIYFSSLIGLGNFPTIFFSTGQDFFIGSSDNPIGNQMIMSDSAGVEIYSGSDLILGGRGYTMVNAGGIIGSYIDIEANADINIRAPTINLEGVSTICQGDIRASTFNGAPLPSGSTWVGTATSDLNMNGYNITTGAGALSIITTTDLFISSFSHLYIDAQADIEIATSAGLTIDVINDIDILGSNSISIIGEGRFDLTTIEGSMNLLASTTMSLDCGEAMTLTASTINLYSPVVNRQLAPATTVIQPVIQHGLQQGNTASAGYVGVTMTHDYGNLNYTVNVTAATNGVDIPSVGIPSFCAIPTSGNTFDCYWYNSSSSNDTVFYWTTFGYYTEAPK